MSAAVAVHRVPRRSRAAAVIEIGSTHLLFHASRRELYELNPAAHALWDAIDGRATVATIAERLAQHFGADREQVLIDVTAALELLDSTRSIDGVPPVERADAIPVPPGSICYAAVDATFALAGPASELMGKAMQLIEPLRVETRDSVDALLWVDDAHDESAALAVLLGEINLVAATGSPASVRFHAGGVEIGGRTVLLPSMSGAGKSTLTCALVVRGAGYLSDEMIGVTAGCRALPFPKAITLADAAAALFPDVPSVVAGGEHHLLVPAATGHGRVDLIVSPRYEPGRDRCLVERLTERDALQLLLENSMDFAATGGAGFEIIGELCKSAPVYKIVYGSLEDACNVVEHLAG